MDGSASSASRTRDPRKDDGHWNGDAVRPVIHLQFREEIVMSVSAAAMPSSTQTMGSSTSVSNTPAFWEHLWRTSGLQFVGFFIITSVIYGYQPQVGASPDALVAFYNGDRTRILVAAVFSGLNLLNLLWFAAALRTSLSEMGQDGWAAAATASSTAFGALSLLQTSVGA